MDPARLQEWYALVPGLMLILARVGALFASAPILGGPSIPAPIKALLSMAVSLLLLPKVVQEPVPMDFLFILALAREIGVGLCLGWILNLYLVSIKIGGDLINRHAGFNAAENFDPDSELGAGPMGDLLHLGAVLLFLGLDGHLHLIASIARSFEVVPLASAHLTPATLDLVTRGVTDSWAIALTLSFPVLTAVMAITVAEGVITRAVPQINIMSISFAIKIGVSVLVVFAGMPMVVAFIGTVLGMMLVLVGPVLGSLR